ncbi:response regulator [Candidatus Aerophobetes bacterium]|uniref:Response regulator n=1 Tax=Aerophobetes bacterium TaxID=2030807 RepID=A0A523RZV7_UNCAE|nr:MAG: response regulator [Candidatus Aerophobetes bacterium]
MPDTKNILVVNDEQAIRQILANMLKDRGYNIFMAEDGYKAIEKVKEISFAITFLDMRMPGIDGVQTLKEIKKISPQTKVIMMTGYPDKNLEKEAIKQGAYTVIYKPFDRKKVMAIVEKLDE